MTTMQAVSLGFLVASALFVAGFGVYLLYKTSRVSYGRTVARRQQAIEQLARDREYRAIKRFIDLKAEDDLDALACYRMICEGQFRDFPRGEAPERPE